MKARVKETGELVEVHTCDDADFQDRQGRYYWEHQLYFGTLDNYDNDPDYWEKLLHQYAGMAMQGLLSNERCWEEDADKIAEVAICYAKELVKGLKLERSN